MQEINFNPYPDQSKRQQYVNNSMKNDDNKNNDNNNNMNNNNNKNNISIECDLEGSTTKSTRSAIYGAIKSVLSTGQATNPESLSVALRNAGFMALIFSGGHGFWWNFECEWSEWSFNDESYKIIVWKPSQNK